MKILVIRHGDPDYALDSLTEKGWREAELLSRRLVKMKIDEFYCSPLGRARATAKPTLEKLGREAIILPWLREFSGYVINPNTGEKKIPWNLAPQYWTEQPEYFDKDRWLDQRLMRTGNVREIYEQTAEGMDELLKGYGYRRKGMLFSCEHNDDKVIALFCHYALGQTIVAHLLGLPAVHLWHSMMLPTSSVTTLVTEERLPREVFFKCFQMGDTSHLYAGDEPVSLSGMFRECAGRPDGSLQIDTD